MLKGVHPTANGCSTETIVMRSDSGTVRIIGALHDFKRKPNLAKIAG